MLVSIDKLTLRYIKAEAAARFYHNEMIGRKNKPIWKHANDCIAEYVLCEAVGLDWRNGGGSAVEEFIAKLPAEHWHGLTVANTEHPDAVYALVTPAFKAEVGNGYILQGWITGAAARALEGDGVDVRPHYRIIDKGLLWSPETLEAYVWQGVEPDGA